MTLDNTEIEIIKKSTTFRHSSNKIDASKFDEILFKIRDNPVSFSTKEKVKLRGCIIESEINPNIKLLNYNELELFFIDSNTRTKYEDFDAANGLLNKLKSDRDELQHIFKPIFDKITKIANCKKIVISTTTNDCLYKLAFMIDTKYGYEFKFGETQLFDFKITNYTADSYVIEYAHNLTEILNGVKNPETDELKILKKIANLFSKK